MHTEIPSTITGAFTEYASDASLFALPLAHQDGILRALTPISFPRNAQHTFQQALNQIEPVLSTTTALYLVLRYEQGFVAITYVPYAADTESKTALLDHRHDLLEKLGKERFSSSIICKEIGEVTDVRSWDERREKVRDGDHDHADVCEGNETCGKEMKDLGHKKNKCRLCDRRMKNKIDDAALEALRDSANCGDCVQISVNVSTEVLQLNFNARNIAPADVALRIPTDKPSFTFYRHANNLLYFIFCSPDSAHVKERMKHTMAIPGLINIIAKDNGVNVDQKVEIHDRDELDFEQKDERIGKFRSMYLRNEFTGTESQWEGMEGQQRILDAIR